VVHQDLGQGYSVMSSVVYNVCHVLYFKVFVGWFTSSEIRTRQTVPWMQACTHTKHSYQEGNL